MQIFQYLQNHWAEIGVAWLGTIKVLTAIQDAIDAEPKGLQPIARVVYYMQAVAGYLFVGNRVKSIGG